MRACVRVCVCVCVHIYIYMYISEVSNTLSAALTGNPWNRKILNRHRSDQNTHVEVGAEKYMRATKNKRLERSSESIYCSESIYENILLFLVVSWLDIFDAR